MTNAPLVAGTTPPVFSDSTGGIQPDVCHQRAAGIMNEPVTIHIGDVLDGLAKIPDGSVQCCVTSPPYWGLRQYLKEGAVVLRRDLPEELKASIVAELTRLGVKPCY